MLKTQKCVHEMMVALHLPLPHENGPGLHNLTKRDFERLATLVDEEHTEFQEAWEEACALLIPLGYSADSKEVLEAWAKVIDGICDVIVTLHNITNAMGIDIEPFFDEIHRTNMAKQGGPKRADGKGLKPEGWQPPRILEMLQTLLCEGKKANKDGRQKTTKTRREEKT